MQSLTPRLNRYIPYPPTTRQAAFLCLTDREVLYGGAAGGGKSDALLMAALQYADLPNYSAVLFRRTFAQLSANDALLPLAMEWLNGTDAQGGETLGGYPTRWRFKSGSVLSFTHLQHLKDIYNHQGPRYDFVGFDELTQYMKRQYLYLFSRLRKGVDSKIPPRVRSASNPGGEGHDWVKERFGIPREPIHRLHQGPKGRLFLPARLDDNPHLDAAQYKESLAELDPVTRKQLLDGNWGVRDGGDLFRREWFDIVLERPPDARKRIRFWDLAATAPKPGIDPDWTVGTLMSVTGAGSQRIWYVESVQRFRKDPAGTRLAVRQTAVSDGQSVIVGLEEEGGASGKDSTHRFKQELAGYTVVCRRPTGKKVERAAGFATSASCGMVKLVRGPWNEAWVDELDAAPDPTQHDDQMDSASGAYRELSKQYGWEELYGEEVIAAEEALDKQERKKARAA